MTRGKLHISEEDFRRYLENEMTVNERNAFEKELHKDPFASEALEGFETVSQAEIKNDLTQLKEKIHPPKRGNRYRYFAAAATILLVVTAGVIWTQFNSQNPVPKVAEKTEDRRQKTEDRSQELENREVNNKEQFQFSEELPITRENTATGTEDLEIAEPDDEIQTQALTSSPKKQPEASRQKQEYRNKQSAAAKQAQKVSRHDPIPTAPELKTAQNVSRVLDSNIRDVEEAEYEVELAEVSSKNRKISGKVISASDNEPLPGVSIIEKGTANGIVTDIDGNFQLQLLNDSSPTVVASFVGMESTEFQPNKDSVYQIELEPGDIALNEVVVVGYESQKRKSLTGSVSMVSKKPKNSQPKPICGMEEYNNYLEDNALLPSNYSSEREVVKLLLKLDPDGELISIENKNNTELEIFEKAKELVLNRPDWNPQIKDGKNIESEVKLKIVFRKKN